MTNEALTFLKSLANELGVAVESLLEVYAAQAKVTIFTSLISVILWTVGIVAAFVVVYKTAIKKDKDGKTLYVKMADEHYLEGTHVGLIFLYVVLGLIAVMGVIMVIYFTRQIMVCALNPQYWAIREIFSVIG